MKRLHTILIAVLMLFVCASANGQISANVPLVNRMVNLATSSPTGLDTLKNADTLRLTKTLSVRARDVAIQVNAKKVSGTASATVILKSSLDGINYSNHFGTSADTFLITNVTTLQQKVFDIGSGKTRTGYRLECIGTGTQNLQLQGVIQYLQ